MVQKPGTPPDRTPLSEAKLAAHLVPGEHRLQPVLG
jgi:hypothetical protein